MPAPQHLERADYSEFLRAVREDRLCEDELRVRPGADARLTKARTDEELREFKSLVGYEQQPLKIFSANHNWREPIFFPQDDVKKVRSSVFRIQQDVERTTDSVRRARNFSIAGAVGVVALVATLFAAVVGAFVYTLTYTDGKVSGQ